MTTAAHDRLRADRRFGAVRQTLLVLGLAASTALAGPSAFARTLQYRLQPGDEQAAEPAPQRLVVAQDSTMTAAGTLLRGQAPAQPQPTPAIQASPAAPHSPSGMLPAQPRNDASGTPRAGADTAEPPSPRAAAAAERAARALAEEDGSSFDGGAPAEAELLPADASTAKPPQGQPVTTAGTKRNTAAAKSPACIAGCY